MSAESSQAEAEHLIWTATGITGPQQSDARDEAEDPAGRSERAEIDASSDRIADLRFKDHEFDHRLKKMLGYEGMAAAFVQLVVANAVFIVYLLVAACHGREVSAVVVAGWFSATVVEVLGIVAIVAKYLYPAAGSDWAHEYPQAVEAQRTS